MSTENLPVIEHATITVTESGCYEVRADEGYVLFDHNQDFPTYHHVMLKTNIKWLEGIEAVRIEDVPEGSEIFATPKENTEA